MSEQMDYEKIIYAVVGAIAGALLNHFFAWSRERRGRIHKNKEKSLKEVYAPIYKILLSDLGDSSEYKGTVKLSTIEEIVHNNRELVDS